MICSELGHTRFSLDLMTVDEALELLNSGEREFGQEAEPLISALGGFPLALELAGNVLNRRPGLNIEGLLRDMKKAGELQRLVFFAEKYTNNLPNGHSKEVTAIFKICWDLAPPAVKSVLQALSMLGPTPVPRRLLQDIPGIHCESFIDNPFDEAISEMANQLSLAELDDDDDPQIHWLISAFVRETTDAPGLLSVSVCRTVVADMARVADESDTKACERLEKTLPHAEAPISSEAIKAESALDLANYLCMHNWKLGRFRAAEKHARRAVEISERHFEPGHPRIATSQSNLGEVLRNIGELKEARDLLHMALESDEKSCEPGHFRIAISQSNLGEVLKNIGELDEARDLLRQVLESGEKSFAPGHLIIALRQSVLALVLQDLGELKEARDLAGRAYRSFLDIFGPEHPYTKTAKRNWESF